MTVLIFFLSKNTNENGRQCHQIVLKMFEMVNVLHIICTVCRRVVLWW